MLTRSVLVLASVLSSAWGELAFPPGFRWGAATAAYQVEGAWNQSDKSPSVWDHFIHSTPDLVADRSTGDVAADSYHLWRRDVEMLEELGLHFYRFSISWTRLVPNGFANVISEDGRRYYDALINGLLESGIEPIPTIYHWDIPQRLQDLGGWTNPLISDWFAEYARVVFSLYANRVKYWVTINEPSVFCEFGYGAGMIAPGIKDQDIGKYMCVKNVLMAHGKAYRVYEREFKGKYSGKLSMANHFMWYEAETEKDLEVAEQIRQFQYGLYCHAIYSQAGGWPAAVERQIADNSRREGYSFSRLPEFTQEEKDLVRGTFDYMAVNHYSSRTVRKQPSAEHIPASNQFTANAEFNATYEGKENWPKGNSFWFLINPAGLRDLLVWLRTEYGDLEYLITENGYSDVTSKINDDDRVDYHREYLKQVLLAINQDGVNVTGYTAWSLMDDFEWVEGYTLGFGLYQVDFSRAERPRTPRKSARYYASVVRANSLDVPEPQDVMLNAAYSLIYSTCTSMAVVFMVACYRIFKGAYVVHTDLYTYYLNN